MPAEVLIVEKNGAAETTTDKTSGTIRFQYADSASLSGVTPLSLPVSGSVYSYEKVLRFKIGSEAPILNISDIEVYSDGENSFNEGVLLWVGTTTGYVQPVNHQSSIATTNFFTYTSGTPLVVGSGTYNDVNTEVGDYIYIQAEVPSHAVAPQSIGITELFLFEYDEL